MGGSSEHDERTELPAGQNTDSANEGVRGDDRRVGANPMGRGRGHRLKNSCDVGRRRRDAGRERGAATWSSDTKWAASVGIFHVEGTPTAAPTLANVRGGRIDDTRTRTRTCNSSKPRESSGSGTATQPRVLRSHLKITRERA